MIYACALEYAGMCNMFTNTVEDPSNWVATFYKKQGYSWLTTTHAVPSPPPSIVIFPGPGHQSK